MIPSEAPLRAERPRQSPQRTRSMVQRVVQISLHGTVTLPGRHHGAAFAVALDEDEHLRHRKKGRQWQQRKSIPSNRCRLPPVKRVRPVGFVDTDHRDTKSEADARSPISPDCSRPCRQGLQKARSVECKIFRGPVYGRPAPAPGPAAIRAMVARARRRRTLPRHHQRISGAPVLGHRIAVERCHRRLPSPG